MLLIAHVLTVFPSNTTGRSLVSELVLSISLFFAQGVATTQRSLAVILSFAFHRYQAHTM